MSLITNMTSSRDLIGRAVGSRKLVAVLFADMVDYSRLLGIDDLGTLERLRTLRRLLIDPAISEHGGRIVSTAGDSLFVAFDSIDGAVRCAVAIQHQVPNYDTDHPADQTIRFRVGINIADVIADGANLHGDGVNVAARLQAACPPGEICVSRAVRDHVHSRLAFVFQELGALSLKNIERPTEAFLLLLKPQDSEAQRSSSDVRTRNDVTATLANWPAAMTTPAVPGYSGPPRIAVLPLRQFVDRTIASHITDGITADIISQLAGLRELTVISHGSTFDIRDPLMDPRQIGRKLNARYLILGSIRRGGDRLRLTTELTEAETGTVIYARTDDTETSISFADQDRIVGQVVNTLVPQVKETELRRIRGQRPDSLSVYEKVLLGREHLMCLTRESFAAAKCLIDDIIRDEPGYGEAYALAADWHGISVGEGWSVDKVRDIAEVERLTRTALSLDSSNIRALVSYGYRRSIHYRDHVGAMELFRRALNIAPSSATAWALSGCCLAFAGNPAEAVRRAMRALDLSPFDREAYKFFYTLCVAYYTAGDYEQAVYWGQRALGETAVWRGAGGYTAASLAALGRRQEAEQVAAQEMAAWPGRRIRTIVAALPYNDAAHSRQYGEHLRAAGFTD